MTGSPLAGCAFPVVGLVAGREDDLPSSCRDRKQIHLRAGDQGLFLFGVVTASGRA